MSEQTDMVEIDRQRYAVTHFTADAEGGSFRALKLLGSARNLGPALLYPGGVRVDLWEATNVSDYTECRFRFL